MPDCDCDCFDLDLALSLVKTPGCPPDLAAKAAAVLARHLDAVLAPPPPPESDEDPAGEPEDFVAGESAGVGEAFAMGAAFEPDGAGAFGVPADEPGFTVVAAGSEADDAVVLNGPVLRRVRLIRQRLADALQARGLSRAEADRRVAAISPVLLLTLLLQYGPDIVRIVREILARLRAN